jgi:hypothetical protein
MHDLVALQVHAREHQRQIAWVNAENWKFAKSVRRYRVRRAIARALIALAHVLAPPTPQEAHST